MSIFKPDQASFDLSGRWLRHTTTSELGRGDLFIDGDIDTDGSVAIRSVYGVVRLQIRENGVFKNIRLFSMVGENLIYNNDLGHVLTNSLDPVYLSNLS